MSLIDTPLFKRTWEYREVCWYCGIALVEPLLNKTHTPSTRTIDHVLPLSRGGTEQGSNKVPCCHRCNAWKADKTLAEFRVIARPGVDDDAALFYGEIREKELAAKNQLYRSKPFNSVLADKLKAATQGR